MNNTILVIEDSRELLENTSELLELAGYEVITATNGKEGLEQLRNVTPALILCDIMMPELDGYGVLRAISNMPELAGIPFVYLTAKVEKGDFRMAMDLGADDYLMKPFTGDELLRVVQARLKKRSKTTTEPGSENADAAMSRIRSSLAMHNSIAERATKKIKSRDNIYMEGDSGTHLYLVKSGKVKLYKTNEWGKEYISKIVNEGDFFGYQALLNDHPHKHGAGALTDSEIGLIPRQEFFQLLYSDKELAMKFICHLSEDMSEAEEKSLHLAYDSARKRVAEALLFIYRQYKKEPDPEFGFDITRENLSAIAGISPESVSRNLTDFRDEHLIATESGKIRIINFPKLAGLRN